MRELFLLALGMRDFDRFVVSNGLGADHVVGVRPAASYKLRLFEY